MLFEQHRNLVEHCSALLVNANQAFPSPYLSVTAALPQIIYVSLFKLGDGAFGYMFLEFYAAFTASFSRRGLQLQDNDAGFGDITTRPFYQSASIMHDGHPFFFYSHIDQRDP